MDKIDWVTHSSGRLHIVDDTVYARVAPATATSAKPVFEASGLSVLGHYSTSKNKLVGYSIKITKAFRAYESGGLSIGIFFSTDGRHENPRIIFDGPMKIHAFDVGTDQPNYAISIRSK